MQLRSDAIDISGMDIDDIDTITIDCDRCKVRGDACAECVISVLLGAPPAVEWDNDEQRAVDALPRREPAGDAESEVVVDATSVVYERDGTPNLGIVSALTADGRRALANTHDLDAMTSMCTKPWEGTTVRLRSDDGANALVV